MSRLKVGQKKEGMLREKSRGNGGEEKGSIRRKQERREREREVEGW